MVVKKCYRCGLQNSFSVNVTAICKKCGAKYTLCGNCKFSWKIQKCPSCGYYRSGDTWIFIVEEGDGKSSDEMMDYLGSYDSGEYMEAWENSAKEREAERKKDGTNHHRGVKLAPEEVAFLRSLEDIMYEPIFTIGDDRGS
ncbi:MAG: hypothetical protein ACTSVC_12615 [Promethearchaeota archaeon]